MPLRQQSATKISTTFNYPSYQLTDIFLYLKKVMWSFSVTQISPLNFKLPTYPLFLPNLLIDIDLVWHSPERVKRNKIKLGHLTTESVLSYSFVAKIHAKFQPGRVPCDTRREWDQSGRWARSQYADASLYSDPSIVKKSSNFHCRVSKVGRFIGSLCQHSNIISYKVLGQLFGHGIR